MHYHAGFTYLKAVLGAHRARLRAAMRDGDRGASAVELAVITAVLVIVAGALLLVIKNFVTANGNAITNNNPNP